VPTNSRIDVDNSPLLPILAHSFEAVALVEPQTWRIVYANQTLRKWLKLPAEGDIQSTLHDVLVTDGGGSLATHIESTWHFDESPMNVDAQLRPLGQSPEPVELRLCRLPHSDQQLLGLIVRLRPAELHHEVPAPEHRDALTGLPDRTFLLSRLASLMNCERAAQRQFAVLFVDLDNFKQVNDTHGHLIGDRVLAVAARRLSDSVRDGDYVVRFGGDEFVLLVDGVTSPSDIEPVVSRIHAVLAEIISLPEGDFTLRVSVGAALASPDHQTPEALLAAADRAMYEAKRLNDGSQESRVARP
jgi:diguanylate cyclase (GGDEF)-like protein